MAELKDFVDVQIARQTQTVATTAFNIPAFLAAHSRFPERSRKYGSLKAVGEDFDETSPVYIAATQYFGQKLKPSTIVIGRKQVPGVDGSIANVADNTLYSVKINDTEFVTTSGVGATDDAIVAALKVEFDAAPVEGINFTDNLDGTFTITTVDPADGVGVSASINVTLVDQVSTESWSDAIQALEGSDNSWIVLNTETHDGEDIKEIAGVIQAREKLYGYSTQLAALKTSATGHFAAELKALGYDKTFGMWNSRADTTYPECAWTGYQIQPLPGSNTWKFKGLVGVYADTGFTTQQYANLEENNLATYESIAGVSATTGSQVASGEYIDVMLGVLWLTARIREAIWFRQVNSDKIPYTNPGKTIIEATLRSVLATAVRNGFLDDNPTIVVVAPDVLTVDQNTRTGRVYDSVTFEGRLAGAIEKVGIRGTVYA